MRLIFLLEFMVFYSFIVELTFSKPEALDIGDSMSSLLLDRFILLHVVSNLGFMGLVLVLEILVIWSFMVLKHKAHKSQVRNDME
jgi:hypothetical protein